MSDHRVDKGSSSVLPIEIANLTRRFGDAIALRDVSFEVRRGEIRALLGPNGAGKTTLLRVCSGLLEPDGGTARIFGQSTRGSPRWLRQRIGLVPAGDRSFYLRISGLENLVFFSRLHGMSRREAVARSHEVLDAVGLRGAERRRVGLYSHGMQKRLSIARALLPEPDVLLVDEATHDLDPEGAVQVRNLVRELADRGSTVIWTTQRIEEIRGFVDTVTVISQGIVRFSGSVPEFLSHAAPRRYLLRLRNGHYTGAALESILSEAIGSVGTIAPVNGSRADDYVLFLEEDVVLGDALARLLARDIQIFACREERLEIEDAFLSLTRSQG